MEPRPPRDLHEIFTVYGDRIYRYALYLCGDATEAEDLTQEVILVAGRGLHTFAGRSSFMAWVCRIARREWQRMSGNRLKTVPLVESLNVSLQQEDPIPAELDRIALDLALAMLPEAQRESLVLIKSVGLKYREVAELTGSSIPTIQSRVEAAARRLQVLLADSHPATAAASSSDSKQTLVRGRSE